MKFHILFITISIVFLSCLVKAQDTIYFDKDWKETTKDNHAFYRPMPLLKEGDLVLIRDYYKNGNLQMQGYAMDNNLDNYVGDIYWYDENGYDGEMSQYLNLNPVKTLVYFHADGSLWQKIVYNQSGEKKKISTYWKEKEIAVGEIDSLKNLSGVFTSDFYARYKNEPYDYFMERSIIESIAPQSVEGKKATEFRIVQFFDNGKKAKETLYENSEYGQSTKLHISVWNAEGNLVSEHKYSNKGSDKIVQEIDFYTSNTFAKGIKQKISINEYGSRDGLSTFYTPNGDILTEQLYKSGDLENIKYYKNGQFDYSNQYQNEKPYNGNFITPVDNLEIVYQMINGLKEGTTLFRIKKSGKVIYQGEYKNGVPYNGVIVNFEDEDTLEVFSYKNGKQDGVQRVYGNTWIYDDLQQEYLLEEYEMKDGKHDGYHKKYIDDIPLTSQYKDGKIVSGTIIDKLTEKTYENGHLIKEKIKQREYDSQHIIVNTYENNQLTTQDLSYFLITENPQPYYRGVYQKGKPFDGYFIGDTIIDNITCIDFYEKGIQKYQYSFDIIEHLENDSGYNLKTTFDKSGKVMDGIAYELVEDGLLYSNHYTKGKLHRFTLDAFAMHYFNRFSFSLEDNALLISNLRSAPYVLKIHKEEGSFIASVYNGDILVTTNNPNNQPKDGTPNTMTIQYYENGVIKIYSFYTFSHQELNEFSELLYSYFPPFPIISNESLYDLLLVARENPIMDMDKQNISWYQLEVLEATNNIASNTIGMIEYDETGQISFGKKAILNTDKTLTIQEIEDGKILESETFGSVEEYLIERDDL